MVPSTTTGQLARSDRNTSDGRPLMIQVMRWYMEQFAYLLRKLKEIPEGDGTVLDHSLVLCTSDMGYGDGHPMDHLPVILAGRGGGVVNPGRHIEVAEQPIANLYVTMLDAAGVPTESFGNSTGALSLT